MTKKIFEIFFLTISKLKDNASQLLIQLNPYHAKFLKWNNPPYIFRTVKMKPLKWSANSIKPGQTAWMCRPSWLYTGGKAYHFRCWQDKGQHVHLVIFSLLRMLPKFYIKFLSKWKNCKLCFIESVHER